MSRPNGAGPTWRLRLYVAGTSPHGVAAQANLERICRDHLQGDFEVEIIDLLVEPEKARRDQIFAIPTLVRELPAPLKKIIGDLSDTNRVLLGLEISAGRVDPAAAEKARRVFQPVAGDAAKLA